MKSPVAVTLQRNSGLTTRPGARAALAAARARRPARSSIPLPPARAAAALPPPDAARSAANEVERERLKVIEVRAGGCG